MRATGAACAANGLDAADADLELRLKVKLRDAFGLFNAAAAEVKLVIEVDFRVV